MNEDEHVEVNEDYYLKGNLEAGVDGVFRQNDKLFNEVKSGTWSQTFKTNNIDYKVGGRGKKKMFNSPSPSKKRN
jgi:hypothetical protein